MQPRFESSYSMQVKYLFNSFKKAREKKLLSEYLFYLQLKSLNLPQGELFKGEIIKTIQSKINISPELISLRLKRLSKKGFVTIYKHANNKEWKIVINSYRTAWNKLGFRFKDKDYIERYRFDLLSIDKLGKDDIRAYIFALELAENKRKQNYKADEQVKRKINYHEQTLSKVKSVEVRGRKEKALLQLKSYITSSEEVHLGGCTKEPIVNKISCKKASRILGYSSQIMTVKIHKKSQSLQLLRVEKTTSLVAKGISKIMFNNNPDYDKCFWFFGKVFKREANSYFINKEILTSARSL